MSAFDDAFEIVLGVEKGYVNDPHDPGGATRYGITERVARLDGYEGDMQDLPLARAKLIAKMKYWDIIKCDEYDPRIAFQLFDVVYNGGKPVLWAQQACGIVADGKLGPMTIAAIKAADPHQFIPRFLAYRIEYLTGLKNWSYDGKGWSRRVANNMLQGAK